MHCGRWWVPEAAAMREMSVMPLPQAPFPRVTLTLGRVTAVIKIDLVSGGPNVTSANTQQHCPGPVLSWGAGAFRGLQTGCVRNRFSGAGE
ncbi:hypothetical protein H8959_020852 [Pygathrix nigripes]